MREELLRAIHDFNQGNCSIEQLQEDLLSLIKRGVRGDLAKHEVRLFNGLFSGWIYMYSENLQPRTSAWGKLLDVLEAIVLGNYRITVEQVRIQTREFEGLLSADANNHRS